MVRYWIQDKENDERLYLKDIYKHDDVDKLKRFAELVNDPTFLQGAITGKNGIEHAMRNSSLPMVKAILEIAPDTSLITEYTTRMFDNDIKNKSSEFLQLFINNKVDEEKLFYVVSKFFRGKHFNEEAFMMIMNAPQSRRLFYEQGYNGSKTDIINVKSYLDKTRIKFWMCLLGQSYSVFEKLTEWGYSLNYDGVGKLLVEGFEYFQSMIWKTCRVELMEQLFDRMEDEEMKLKLANYLMLHFAHTTKVRNMLIDRFDDHLDLNIKYEIYNSYSTNYKISCFENLCKMYKVAPLKYLLKKYELKSKNILYNTMNNKNYYEKKYWSKMINVFKIICDAGYGLLLVYGNKPIDMRCIYWKDKPNRKSLCELLKLLLPYCSKEEEYEKFFTISNSFIDYYSNNYALNDCLGLIDDIFAEFGVDLINSTPFIENYFTEKIGNIEPKIKSNVDYICSINFKDYYGNWYQSQLDSDFKVFYNFEEVIKRFVENGGKLSKPYETWEYVIKIKKHNEKYKKHYD